MKGRAGCRGRGRVSKEADETRLAKLSINIVFWGFETKKIK